MNKNIPSGKPNEKVKIKYQYLSSIAAQACFFNEESLCSHERVLMTARKPNFISEKYSYISEKDDYAHKPWVKKKKKKPRKNNKKPSRPCCLQEQTSAFAFENDQIVPVGILGWQNVHK